VCVRALTLVAFYCSIAVSCMPASVLWKKTACYCPMFARCGFESLTLPSWLLVILGSSRPHTVRPTFTFKRVADDPCHPLLSLIHMSELCRSPDLVILVMVSLVLVFAVCWFLVSLLRFLFAFPGCSYDLFNCSRQSSHWLRRPLLCTSQEIDWEEWPSAWKSYTYCFTRNRCTNH